LFDRVVVSTDDQEIADIAMKWGAEVPFIRPEYLSDDHTGTMEVIQHAITVVQTQQGICYDYTCCIYATAPFIRIDDLKKGYEILATTDKRFAFPVTSFPASIFRAIKIDVAMNALSMFWPEYELTRTQDLPEAFHDVGQFYWGRTMSFLEGCSMIEEYTAPIIVPRYFTQDIDTQEDWDLAERLFQTLKPD
jgi:pseudaminic acid cytidylyltransferase